MTLSSIRVVWIPNDCLELFLIFSSLETPVIFRTGLISVVRMLSSFCFCIVQHIQYGKIGCIIVLYVCILVFPVNYLHLHTLFLIPNASNSPLYVSFVVAICV